MRGILLHLPGVLFLGTVVDVEGLSTAGGSPPPPPPPPPPVRFMDSKPEARCRVDSSRAVGVAPPVPVLGRLGWMFLDKTGGADALPKG